MKIKLTKKLHAVNHSIRKIIIRTCFLLISFISYSQTQNNYQEKIYLHLDKNYYTSDDTIWFKAYVVDAQTNRPIVLSKILYVDLINPLDEIIFSRTLKIEEGGTAGDFQLPINLITGKYRLRAYTNYMRNFDEDYFFRKEITINNLRTTKLDSIEPNSNRTKKEKYSENINLKPDLQFFPEGGNMVTGISNRIGFKLINIGGKGVSVRGKILDDKGFKITEFSTAKFGMGLLELKPLEGVSYTAQINFNGENYSYALPRATPKGIAIQVSDYKDVFKIILKSSLPEGIKGLVVIGKQGNDIVCRSEISKSGLNAIVNIPKEFLKEGIVQFTVFDENNTPQCERLVFVDTKEKEPRVNMLSTKETYKSRELLELNVKLSSQSETVEQTSISIAVTDVSVVQKEKNGLNIKSHLLLNSELKGYIEQPNYYLESNDPQRKQMLDILMMTQGWRRYLWSDIESDSLQKSKYEIEKDFTISGTVRNFYNKNKTVPATVTLLTMNKNTINNFVVDTDDQGKFEFGPYTISDSITVVIKAKKREDKDKVEKKRTRKPINNYAIEMNTREVPKIRETIKDTSIEVVNDDVLEINDSIKKALNISSKSAKARYNERSRDKYYNDSILKVEKGTVFLDEVKLEGDKEESIEEKLKQIKKEKRYLVKEPNYSLSFKELDYIPSNPLLALQGRVPGLDFKGESAVLNIFARVSPMQVLLDGMPIKDEDIGFLHGDNIDFIDVIKPPRSYIHGSKGHYGIIAIYSKDAETEVLHAEEKLKNEKRPEITKFVHPGYYQAKEFYNPVYKASKPELMQPDFRSTIYWNPNVKLNENGEGNVSFYASDIPTSYRVNLEGITIEGIPFTEEIFVKIKN